MNESSVVVAALYKFVALDNPQELQPALKSRCLELGIKGTLLLAAEGINGTIAGSRNSIDSILAFLRSDPRLQSLEHKESIAAEMPFLRLKVRLKNEIVTMGVDGVDPTTQVGTYVDPEDWNALISDPDVVLVDTRNNYEVAMGTFQGAIDPLTRNFRQFPEWIQSNEQLQQAKSSGKKVAMFCTGGIRCEKASAYLLSEGFEQVFHLKGGILKYLERVSEQDSLWNGDCYVFDNRVSVRHGLEEGDLIQCFACSYPVWPGDEQYVEGIQCANCVGTWSEEQLKRFRERQRQIELSRSRQQEPHLGQNIQQQKRMKLHQLHVSHKLPILYSFRRCPYAMRARLALSSAGARYEHREISLRDKPTHLLKTSPKGTVPVLLFADGTVLEESLDIMFWALNHHNPEQWSTEVEPRWLTLLDDQFKPRLDAFKYDSNECTDSERVALHHQALEKCTAVVERLHQGPYLSGERFGLLDAAWLPFIRQFAHADRVAFDRSADPRLVEWLDLGLGSPRFSTIMAKYPLWSLGTEPLILPLVPEIVQQPSEST